MKTSMIIKLFIISLFLISALLAVSNLVIVPTDLRLTSLYVNETLPTTDPNSDLWNRIEALDIPLSGQTVQIPMRFEPFAEKIRIKSLNNGSEIVFLLEWTDLTKNDRTVKTEEFHDAVAITFSGADRLFLCMGAIDQKSNIVQWKADWQKDIEDGFQDIQHAFPNFWVDVYPQAVGEAPYQLPEAFPEDARVYLPGWQVGNPFSEPLRVTPVEETVAAGFGTITTQESQDSVGRGLWQQESWKVVIARKLNTEDINDLQLSSTEEHAVAFAIWDGASFDVGARKSVSAWLALSLESTQAYGWFQSLIPSIITSIIAILLVFIFLIMRKKET